MNTDVMFSSRTDNWATPTDLFNKLNEEFHFNLDPCASADNHKCDRYFTKEQDGLKQNWGGNRVFCNPPYGKEINKWVLVEPVRGEWVPEEKIYRSPLALNYRCSQCGETSRKTNFCPNCGCDMRGEKND